MATYGEGDPTDNAQEFHDWLMETDTDLTGVRYAVSYFLFQNDIHSSVYSRIKKGEGDKISKGHFYLLGAHLRCGVVTCF